MFKIISFYLDGFKGMKLGKTLWLIISIKLFIMFVIVKTFFYQPATHQNFETDLEKAEYFSKQYTR